MYHYLKWAALSLFFKRNLRYIVLIVIGFVGIFIADAVYQDMAQYALMTKKSGMIIRYLWMKWSAVLIFSALILWSIMRLGFARKSASKKESKKPRKTKKIPEEDPYMKRLKKFEDIEKVRSETEILLEKKRRQKREKKER